MNSPTPKLLALGFSVTSAQKRVEDTSRESPCRASEVSPAEDDHPTQAQYQPSHGASQDGAAPHATMWSEMLRIPALSLLLLVFATGLPGACGAPDVGPAFAVAAVTLDRSSVPLGGRLEMVYRFTALPQIGTLTEPPRVLVQFLDADGKVLFTDDHDPPVATTAWRPGETITYRRPMYIPVRPYVGQTSIWLALSSPATGERLPLADEQTGGNGYVAATIDLAPPQRSSFPTFQNGWHRLERARGREWRWTKGIAVMAFSNPRQDSTLYLDLAGRPDLFDSPQRIDFVIGGRAVDSLLLETSGDTFHTVTLNAGDFGDDDTTELILRVDQTFVPALLTGTDSTDTRRLGVRVLFAYLETT